MTRDISCVAEQIIGALSANLVPSADLYADPVRVLHDPPAAEFDGDKSLAGLLAHMEREREALDAVPDFRYDAFNLTTRDDGFTLEFTLRGRDAEVSPLNVPARMDYLVVDGRIIQITAWLDPATVHELIAVLSLDVESNI